MKRTSLSRWIPIRLAAFVAPLIAAWPQRKVLFTGKVSMLQAGSFRISVASA